MSETSRTLRFLRETHKVTKITLKAGYQFADWGVRPHVICHDGFSMSVQASPGMYCNLRDFDTLLSGSVYNDIPADRIPYATCEVYCLSEPEPLFDEFGSGEDPYGWVPLDIIDEVIAKHGGMACDPIPPKPRMRVARGRRNLDL